MAVPMLLQLSLLLGVASAAQEQQVPITSAPYLLNPPLLGFGTWNLNPDNATEAVSHAIQTGYRHIDGAAAYRNEELVGKGIKDGLAKANLPRNSIWVTSKLWNDQ